MTRLRSKSSGLPIRSIHWPAERLSWSPFVKRGVSTASSITTTRAC
jgi:hypothetical protein